MPDQTSLAGFVAAANSTLISTPATDPAAPLPADASVPTAVPAAQPGVDATEPVTAAVPDPTAGTPPPASPVPVDPISAPAPAPAANDPAAPLPADASVPTAVPIDQLAATGADGVVQGQDAAATAPVIIGKEYYASMSTVVTITVACRLSLGNGYDVVGEAICTGTNGQDFDQDTLKQQAYENAYAKAQALANS